MPARRRSSVNDYLDRGEVLVAIMKSKADFAILREHLWYRLPVTTAPKAWPPKWLAFYQTKVFKDEAFAVNYYGRVNRIETVTRAELFPGEIASAWSERRYHRLWLDKLERLEAPIRSRRLRRIVFIPTTWQKFTAAAEINDLWHESRLEDLLWHHLKELEIRAERQFEVKVGKTWYFLDFAVTCAKGSVDLETDGDTWHSERAQIARDNRRDNNLQALGWHILRFNGQQIREQTAEYCVPKIRTMINRLGGLTDEGLAPRKFYDLPEGSAEQLGLFEEGGEYDLD